MMHANGRNRILIDLRALGETDQALVNEMLADLSPDVNLGDERAIILALTGRHKPSDILAFMDHLVDAARTMKQQCPSSWLGDAFGVATIFALGILGTIAVSLIPDEAMAADGSSQLASAAWAILFPVLILSIIAGAMFWRWVSPPRVMPETELEQDPQSHRYEDFAQ